MPVEKLHCCECAELCSRPEQQRAADAIGRGCSMNPNWRLGSNHSAQQWANKMAQRGWTAQQITEAMANGQRFSAANNVNLGNPATRYVHPTTGRSVVVDDVTEEVIHVGADGFLY
jgi:hypothetical protein